MAVVFVELGQNVHITGGDLRTAIDGGVKEGYRQGYLRPSTLDPITRVNYGDKTPAIIHMDLVRINRLGIGPQGLGGRTTALAVHVETYPIHIGSLPVAVNLQCHSHRRCSAEL